jgi:hypothetical protein
LLNPSLNTVPQEQRVAQRINEPSNEPVAAARALVSAALLVVLLRVILSLALIPPWQQPDEPSHVAVAELWRSRADGSTSTDPGREGDIIRSMIAHQWWEHYGRTPPENPALRFIAHFEKPIGADPLTSNFSRAYYWVVGHMLAVAPRMAVETDMYVMRTLSAAFAMILVWIAWLGAREALGDVRASVVVFLLALQPQFAVTATSANPDMLIDLAGACIWWQSMVALNRPRSVLPLALVWVAAGSAAFVDRMGVPLLVIALLVTLVIAIRRAGFRPATLALAAVAVTAVAAALWVIDTTWRVFPSAALGYQFSLVPEARSWEFFGRFTSFLVESWWLALGWVRYAPPRWWLAIVFLVSAAALAGVVWRMVKGDDARSRAVLLVAIVMVAVPLLAVYWTYYRSANGPQGRHLFPVLVPTIVLLWMGIERLVPLSHRRHAAIALVLTFAVLDSLAWILVTIPAYAG